jgi:release factor glutamine methyltransferase
MAVGRSGRAGAPTAGVGTAAEAVAAATDSLAAAGCEAARLDAELLIADALGVDRAALLARPELPVEPRAARIAMERIRRRATREPVAYILGRRAFRRLELSVDPRVLVPRPETELLVEVAVEGAPAGGRVHDVGTGSGAVALALKDERPDLEVSGSDASPGAIDVARGNATRLGIDVEFAVTDGWPAGARAGRRPDLVVANLPYVSDDEWPDLQPEIVRYEPREALAAGADGLDAIRALVRATPPGTRLALEHAPDQARALGAMLDGAETHRDLAGRARVTVGTAPIANDGRLAGGAPGRAEALPKELR